MRQSCYKMNLTYCIYTFFSYILIQVAFEIMINGIDQMSSVHFSRTFYDEWQMSLLHMSLLHILFMINTYVWLAYITRCHAIKVQSLGVISSEHISKRQYCRD